MPRSTPSPFVSVWGWGWGEWVLLEWEELSTSLSQNNCFCFLIYKVGIVIFLIVEVAQVIGNKKIRHFGKFV